ncbi:metallophosphoesterase [Thermogutta sp.]|uniref:metallophosphoesterase n=1 Tax=Thermogutta sp. TaxID=1962930 RepID=UPI003C7BA096
MTTFLIFLLLLAVLGHITIWAALWNRLHGFGLSFGVCSWVTALLVAIGAVVPTTLITLILEGDLPLLFLTQSDVERSQVGLYGAVAANLYIGACLLALPFAIGWRIWRNLRRPPAVLKSSACELLFDLAPVLKSRSGLRARARAGAIQFLGLVGRRKALLRTTGWRKAAQQESIPSNSWQLSGDAAFPIGVEQPGGARETGCSGICSEVGQARISGAVFHKNTPKSPPRRHHPSSLLFLPGNESLACHRVELALSLPELPSALNGLRIVQLSDLHFVGRIPDEFYQLVVEHSNRLEPDLVLITGDIVDRKECIPQAQKILAPLRAKSGVFFILGNHDLRAGVENVRTALTEIGFKNVGGRVEQLSLNGTAILVGGNELPWLGPAPSYPCHDSVHKTPHFRLLLAHTPDQFYWAIRNKIHLMFAGHTHGGQACLPWLGPIIAPSAYGIRYAQGLYHKPPTTMYVSRGIGGEFPLRYFCPPEITCLTLFSETSGSETAPIRLS